MAVFALLQWTTLVAFAQGVPANPFPVWITQPDGETKFQARNKGDERRAWKETLDGYTIVRNKSNCTRTDENSCWWEYAVKGPRGELVPSGVPVLPKGSVEEIPFEVRPPKGLRPAK